MMFINSYDSNLFSQFSPLSFFLYFHSAIFVSIQFTFDLKMNRITFVLLTTLISSTFCEENVETKTPGDELSKEEIYNINTDMYCQTQYVIDKKLLEVDDELVNTYTEILGDDIKDIDCEAILTEYVLRVHKRLRKDFQKKSASFKTIECFMGKVNELGYDEMRFRFNSLYGIELEKEKKDKLRNDIDEEIGNAVDAAVNECWPEDNKNKLNVTKSAEKQ